MSDLVGNPEDRFSRVAAHLTFLSNFRARVNHVGCDAKAWPSCNKAAVELKNEFECELIPSRCHNSHRDNVDEICPNTGNTNTFHTTLGASFVPI